MPPSLQVALNLVAEKRRAGDSPTKTWLSSVNANMKGRGQGTPEPSLEVTNIPSGTVKTGGTEYISPDGTTHRAAMAGDAALPLDYRPDIAGAVAGKPAGYPSEAPAKWGQIEAEIAKNIAFAKSYAAARANPSAVDAIDAAAPMQTAPSPLDVRSRIAMASQEGWNAPQQRVAAALAAVPKPGAPLVKTGATKQGGGLIDALIQKYLPGATGSLTFGHIPQWERATAISSGGQTPGLVMGSSNPAFDAAYHPDTDMAVYRANHEAVGGPITQQSIAEALGAGKTLYKTG